VSHITFDSRRLVKDYGGLTATARKLTAHGYVISVDGVDKWRRRKTVPFTAIVHLCMIAKESNRRFDLLDYVTEMDTKDARETNN
tara:strand:+ start:2563 stop:2817 length:255 start_codon:yes stop_codon:yes gene_type:complete